MRMTYDADGLWQVKGELVALTGIEPVFAGFSRFL
jgi:hypothetical protein